MSKGVFKAAVEGVQIPSKFGGLFLKIDVEEKE